MRIFIYSLYFSSTSSAVHSSEASYKVLPFLFLYSWITGHPPYKNRYPPSFAIWINSSMDSSFNSLKYARIHMYTVHIGQLSFNIPYIPFTTQTVWIKKFYIGELRTGFIWNFGNAFTSRYVFVWLDILFAFCKSFLGTLTLSKNKFIKTPYNLITVIRNLNLLNTISTQNRTTGDI